MPICLDASIVVKLLVRESDSYDAIALLDRARERGCEFVAPTLLRYEVVNTLWQRVRRSFIEPGDGLTGIERLAIYQIRYYDSSELSQQAWALTQRLSLSAAYDAHYLAVAEHQRCAFWTADRRLAIAAADWSGDLRLLGRDPIAHA